MDNVAQPAGGQPYRVPEQMVASPQVNASPFYVPNLIAAMVASVGVVIGSIGPWVTVFAFSRSNVDGDGMITLVLGVVASAALFGVLNLGRSGVRTGWMMGLACVGVGAGAICLAVAVIDIVEIMSRRTEVFGQTISAQVGWGLWMVLIGSLVLVATASVVANQIPKARKA